jgi:hypothetical protein
MDFPLQNRDVWQWYILQEVYEEAKSEVEECQKHGAEWDDEETHCNGRGVGVPPLSIGLSRRLGDVGLLQSDSLFSSRSAISPNYTSKSDVPSFPVIFTKVLATL